MELPMWIRRLKLWLTGAAIQNAVLDLPECAEARSFANSFAPQAGTDYGWILEQAVKEYEIVDTRMRELDGKVDSLIGYLGAGEGILALASAYIVADQGGWFLIVSVPALALFLMAMILAVIARAPTVAPVFPSTRYAFACIARKSVSPSGQFAAYISATSRIALLFIRKKSRIVRISYWSFAAGIVWFVVSAIIYASLRLASVS